VVREILTGIDDLAFMYLSSRDVVRHRIVQDIVEAYRRLRRGQVLVTRTSASTTGPPAVQGARR
jgi:phosphate starvation-inducible PhoH-like protein